MGFLRAANNWVRTMLTVTVQSVITLTEPPRCNKAFFFFFFFDPRFFFQNSISLQIGGTQSLMSSMKRAILILEQLVLFPHPEGSRKALNLLIWSKGRSIQLEGHEVVAWGLGSGSFVPTVLQLSKNLKKEWRLPVNMCCRLASLSFHRTRENPIDKTCMRVSRRLRLFPLLEQK